jgi:hypothetical protein
LNSRGTDLRYLGEGFAFGFVRAKGLLLHPFYLSASKYPIKYVAPCFVMDFVCGPQADIQWIPLQQPVAEITMAFSMAQKHKFALYFNIFPYDLTGRALMASLIAAGIGAAGAAFFIFNKRFKKDDLKDRSTTSSAGGGSAAYETAKAVDEYLQFHFGADQDIMPYKNGPKVRLLHLSRCIYIQLHQTA